MGEVVPLLRFSRAPLGDRPALAAPAPSTIGGGACGPPVLLALSDVARLMAARASFAYPPALRTRWGASAMWYQCELAYCPQARAAAAGGHPRNQK